LASRDYGHSAETHSSATVPDADRLACLRLSPLGPWAVPGNHRQWGEILLLQRTQWFERLVSVPAQPLEKCMQRKSQHFVPKCYMRPFSVKNDGRSICAYNIQRDLFVASASIKDQCAKDYFYDRTGEMEEIFGGCEGEYTSIVRKISENMSASEEDLSFIRHFAYLQYLRTDAWAKNQAAALAEMANFVFDEDPVGRSWVMVDPKLIPRDTFAHFLRTALYIHDLRDCLVINQSKYPFITSDNPSVIVNRFHIQKSKYKFIGSGLMSSGLTIVLPLSPRVAFVSYDRGVYTAKLQGSTVVTKKQRDVEALNALQVLKASDNIYFGSADNSEYVKNIVKKYKCRRPNAWYRWNFAVEDSRKDVGNRKYYRVIETSAEFKAGSGLAHLESISVDPGAWCSLFSFRSKPSVVDTCSAAGFVRSENLLRLNKALREPSRPVTIPR
jgi:hypothetical protein